MSISPLVGTGFALIQRTRHPARGRLSPLLA